MLAFIISLKEWYHKYTRVSPIYTSQHKGTLYEEYPNLQKTSVFLDCDKLRKLVDHSHLHGYLRVMKNRHDDNYTYTVIVCTAVSDIKVSIDELLVAHPVYMKPLLSALAEYSAWDRGHSDIGIAHIASVPPGDTPTYVSGINAALDALIREIELKVKQHLSAR